jgi:hypothetical protein
MLASFFVITFFELKKKFQAPKVQPKSSQQLANKKQPLSNKSTPSKAQNSSEARLVPNLSELKLNQSGLSETKKYYT